MEAVKKALPYYILIIRALYEDKKNESKTFRQLALEFNTQHKEYIGHNVYSEFHSRMLLHAIRQLVHLNAIRVISDEFAPEFLIWSVKGIPQLASHFPDVQIIYEKMKPLTYKDKQFLHEAAQGFAWHYRDDVIKYLDTEDISFEKGDDIDSSFESIESEIDAWVPLPLERESIEAKDAIKKSENALKEIEQNNGYAASTPDERNGIVDTIRGTITAIKSGFPSRSAIISGLLAPLKFIAKKFSDASMGEAAKIAVAAIIKWLF